jgi:hypothetical protein
MDTVVSFHASDVPAEQISAIVADSLALEHLRIFRRLLVVRCGLIASAIATLGAGFHLLPTFAWWFGSGMFLSAPSVAWILEIRCARRLALRLGGPPVRKS